MSEALWKATARCSREGCGKILNTAEHVPESKKARVGMTAPLNAICVVPGHSTFSDCNYAFTIEWEQEEAST